jgi:hypothetical protein
MKRALLFLSCALTLSACKHIQPKPDFSPSRDIPAGTIVQVVLSDRKDPNRVSTFIVDAREGRVLERRDGPNALEPRQSSLRGATASLTLAAAEQDAQQDTSGSQTLSSKVSTTFTAQVDCPPPPEGAEPNTNGCILANAIDPRLETTGDRDPKNEALKRTKKTLQFVIRLAQSGFEAAKLNGVILIQPQSLQQRK